MNSVTTAPLFSISAVERDTGVPKDTLRVWERRYSFPLPERDENGERLYTQEQVDKLRALKRLIDRGHRPSKIIGHSIDELLALVDAAAAPDDGNGELAPVFERLRAHQVEELRQTLAHMLARQGLARFLVETVGRLNRAVGEAWMRGRLEVFEEHLYTETLQGILRNALTSIPRHDERPRVLLTTFPNEQHALGLLMAEAMLALEGATCISLGTQTPIGDIVAAARSHRADVIAVSFSLAYPATLCAEGLAELRGRAPQDTAIWAGGGNPALVRRQVEGVTPLVDLADVPDVVAQWRAAHGMR
jgi:DNA-binding transcriptional MerR regulator/methylmalonyl-CoA mutase cobalamin-binding subunit